MWIGICLATGLTAVFLISRALFLGEIESYPGDFRMAVIHILLSAYIASAYVYLLQAAKNSVVELEPVIEANPELRIDMDRAGTHLWWGLVIAGLMGILVGIYATNVTTIGSDPWDWQQTGFDTRWMRVLGPIIGWLAGCMLYVLAVESTRLSKLTDSILSFDLLDLDPYLPFITTGLTNALLVVGLVSVMALFLLEPGFFILMIQLFSVIAVFAWIGLMLPLRGIRRKIKQAKRQELEWCRQALKLARDELKTGRGSQQSLTEILSYKSMLEDIRNWPFDSPSLTRFALYLLIPIGSMFGGVLVERGMDFFFP